MRNKNILTVLLVLTILFTGCAPAKSITAPVSEPGYWPTAGWQSSSPEAQGMDSELLSQMVEDVIAKKTRIHSILVIRNGYMVTEAYFHPYIQDTKTHIQSVTKSVIGTLVGIGIQEGYIKGADEKMLSFFPNRVYANPSRDKDTIRLKHLLTMSSGLDCQEFSGSGLTMEQTSGWVQFMLDLPVVSTPGKTFGYCNGNAHLLSAILEKTTGMNTREFANQALFAPLGIPPAGTSDWWTDPQGFSTGGFGLFLRPIDIAKIAFLYLHNGVWEGQQLLPTGWVNDSATQFVKKEDGSGYGYLWTVYPETGHYAALGMAGQQIHIYPSKKLIVIVTAELESYAEAPEIERMLNEFILPAIQSDAPLAGNVEGVSRLQAAVEMAANPVQPVPVLPAIAGEVSGQLYTLEENINGWQNIVLFFEPGAPTAKVSTNGYDNQEDIGLDNIYRLGHSEPNHLLRGSWVNDQTFVVEWMPMPGNNGTHKIQAKFNGDRIELNIQPVIPSGKPLIITGKR